MIWFWFLQLSLCFANPQIAINEDFPDPTVIRAGDGYYYAYATGSEGRLVSVSRSKNLRTWDPPQEALVTSVPAGAVWAPHVTGWRGGYVMHFAFQTSPGSQDEFRIGVAAAASPAGPFVFTGEILDTGPAQVNIDPMIFTDPRSGRTVLFWGRDGEIAAQELDSTLRRFKAGSRPKIVLRPQNKRYRRVVEGPWLYYHSGYYYLFTSGDDCCEKPLYAAVVARSRSVWGPYTVSGKPVLSKDSRWLAPGHNSIVQDEKAGIFIAYHAVDRLNPRDRDGQIRRAFLIRALDFANSWPEGR